MLKSRSPVFPTGIVMTPADLESCVLSVIIFVDISNYIIIMDYSLCMESFGNQCTQGR